MIRVRALRWLWVGVIVSLAFPARAQEPETAPAQEQTREPAADSLPEVVPLPTQAPDEALGSYREGDPVPDLAVTLLTNGTPAPSTLSVPTGGILVLYFFAKYSAPCKTDSKSLETEVWKKYRDKKVSVVGIAVRDSFSQAWKFHQDQGLTFPVALDAEGKLLGAFPEAGVGSVVVLDKKKVIRLVKGYDTAALVEKIEELRKKKSRDAKPGEEPAPDEAVPETSAEPAPEDSPGETPEEGK